MKPARQTSPALDPVPSTSSWALRLWDRFAGQHLRWIDDNSALPEGRVSQTTRCTVVFLVGALTLTAISYGVLSGPVQEGISGLVLTFLEWLSPDLRESFRPYQRLAENFVWSLGCFTFYFVMPALVIRRVFGHRLRDYGLEFRGFLRHLPIYLLLFLPVGVLVLLVARNPDFQHQYPFYRNPVGVTDFLVWECFYALQFFSLEFFFRGFMLHGVKDRLGRFAIFAAVIPYVMIHFRKPLFETLGAVIAGSVLGGLSLRTGSVLGGFFIHVAVAITMDIAALAMRG